ncbi:YbjN domain-containing protein [Jiangella gansuensis]|uniref:YbjN domain-containing protein n=1 Tax=Jiangella gansuensis TaxID=281473 RepID=UPI0004B91497|nr:YbjN domain-containing protein [Jiangella gansuensis]
MSQLDRLRAQLPIAGENGQGHLPVRSAPITRTSAAPARTGQVADNEVRDLIAVVLDDMEAEYVDEDDEFLGAWENGVFDFSVLADTEGRSEVVHVHGVWERVLPADDYAAAAIFANDWNATHVWPKVFAQLEGDVVGIHSELSADFGPSPTVDQIDRVINAGIVSSLAVFDKAESAFRHARLVAAEIDEA